MTTTLNELRALAPRDLSDLPAALLAADTQANLLLRLSSVTSQPVPDRIICDLPRLHVERLDLGETSGAAQWSLGRWVVMINRKSTIGRQRFSLFHEFKHIIDHDGDRPIAKDEGHTTVAEQLCDYFAACALMPRAWVEATWHSGMRDVATLARHFQVSISAMRVRLLQVGLLAPVEYTRHTTRPYEARRTR